MEAPFSTGDPDNYARTPYQIMSQAQAAYPCACCGYFTCPEGPGSWFICPICFWEDDYTQLQDPAYAGGANRVSLIDAQANFATHGCSEVRLKEHCRPVEPTDARDQNWRPFDPSTDTQPEVTGGREGLLHLYYWRRDLP